jgi:hypothetical protein
MNLSILATCRLSTSFSQGISSARKILPQTKTAETPAASVISMFRRLLVSFQAGEGEAENFGAEENQKQKQGHRA